MESSDTRFIPDRLNVQASDIPAPPQPAKTQDAPRHVLRPRKPRSDKGKPHHLSGAALKRDNQLIEEHWLEVYQAFQHTGVPDQLAQVVGLDVRQVQHLLDHGIRRLGLPPIREHATDLAQVNTRLAERNVSPLPPSRDPTESYTVNLPEVQDAVSERVGHEAAGAQHVLKSAMHAGAVFNKFLKQVYQVVEDDPDRMVVPDKITLNYLKTLGEAADKLASAMDRAVRLARLAAGEPDQSLNVLVAHLVCNLPPEVLQRFGETGQIPPELRGRVQATTQIIEAEAEIKPKDDE
jgi:signal transduction histidine kinase